MSSATDQTGSDRIVGSGEFTYRVVQNWAKLPKGWEFKDAAAVAVDKRDRVFVFSRGGHPVTIFDRDGNFESTWGEKLFKRPHGLHMAPDDTLYCTDDGDHTVRKCTLDGKVLLEIGVPNQPSKAFSGLPFSRCTHTALSPQGEIYVADGYKNARVHKYTPDGKLLLSWGESGTDPGQFNIPHNVCCDEEGWVYVADRENNRVQVFDANGRYETQWNDLYRACALYMERGKAPLSYIGELPGMTPLTRHHPNIGGSIKIAAKGGEILARIGDPQSGAGPGHFLAPHGLAVDSHGDIYVSEVSHSAWPQLYPSEPIPADLRSIHKLVKVPAGTAK